MIPDQLDLLDSWLETERKAYRDYPGDPARHGRVGTPADPKKAFREWWVLRRVVGRPGWQAVFGESFLAEHTDIDGREPDFMATLSDGSRMAVEVTEATTPEDRRAITRGRFHPEPRLVGDTGGRGKGGWVGNDPEIAVANDVAEAIARKGTKTYGVRTVLLIYANSNPASVVHDPARLVAELEPVPSDTRLDHALLVVCCLPLILIDRFGASVVD